MRMLKAIEYIERRLTGELSLADVAGAAGLSNYHFSRLFSEVAGEPMTSYIRRRRLTEAARRLHCTNDRVIDLAILYGFDSQAAFSRAFKRQFGVPPGEYRRNRRPIFRACRAPIRPDDFEHEEIRAMEPQIVEKPALKAIGMADRFTLATQPEIPGLWRRFVARRAEIPAVVGDHGLGLCIDVDDDENEDAFVYAPAVEVTSLDKVPDGMQPFDLGPGTYAVFTVPLAGAEPIGKEIGRAFRFIWNTWLPKSGYTFAGGPEIEFYDDRFDPATMSGEIELWIPVRQPD